jgi:integrase
LFPARIATATGEQFFTGWSQSKKNFDKLLNIAPWTLHDLRRTFATNLADLGVAPHVIERLLNHVTGTISGVAAIYNRSRYEPEMKAAMELWETRLQDLLQ